MSASVGMVVMTVALLVIYIVVMPVLSLLNRPMIARKTRTMIRWVERFVVVILLLVALITQLSDTASDGDITWAGVGITFVAYVILFTGFVIYYLPARFDDDLDYLDGWAVKYDERLRKQFGNKTDVQANLVPAMLYSYKDADGVTRNIALINDERVATVIYESEFAENSTDTANSNTDDGKFDALPESMRKQVE